MKRSTKFWCFLLLGTLLISCLTAGCAKNTTNDVADTNTEVSTETPENTTPIEEDTTTESDATVDTTEPEAEPEPEVFSTFTIITEPFDAGQAVTKVIIDRKEEVTADTIDKTNIKVMAEHCNTRRTITDAYPSDSDGNRVEAGQYLTLELEHTFIGYSFTNGASTLTYDMSTWTNKPLELKYSVTIGDLYFAQGEIINVLEDEFSYETSESGLNYRLFCPEDESTARPLIIWLHGMGEGGSDNRVQIVGNKACNLASDEIQAYFGGAYVAAPQCPDFWAGNFNFAGKSPYVEPMIALIEEVISSHNVDASRVYIGGCSMGGYMTWQTILERPDMFAATFPTCAAYAPTAEDAQKIADAGLPVWVVYAANDKTVDPDQFPRASVATLEAAGATVKVTEFPNVVEDGINYDGHWSWVYVYNNHVYDENGLSLMEWMASQSR